MTKASEERPQKHVRFIHTPSSNITADCFCTTITTVYSRVFGGSLIVPPLLLPPGCTPRTRTCGTGASASPGGRGSRATTGAATTAAAGTPARSRVRAPTRAPRPRRRRPAPSPPRRRVPRLRWRTRRRPGLPPRRSPTPPLVRPPSTGRGPPSPCCRESGLPLSQRPFLIRQRAVYKQARVGTHQATARARKPDARLLVHVSRVHHCLRVHRVDSSATAAV